MILPLLLAALVAELPVEATSLTGGDVQGQLVELTAEELKLQPQTGAALSLATSDLLELRFKPDTTAVPNAEGLIRARLTDGSLLQLGDVKTTSKELRGKHPLIGEIVIPMSAVASLRLAAPNPKFDPLWDKLLEEPSKTDMVVVQKTEVLDHLDGVVGNIDEQSIKFLLDGDDIPVKREKAFGLIYARKPSSAKLAARAKLSNGDVVSVKSISTNGEEWKLISAAGPTWTLPAAGVGLVDYKLGKIVYLSAVDPRNVKYTPWIGFDGQSDFFWKFRRDRSLEGKPLRLGQKTYARGLAIHSKTELRYRLGGEFRRFQALMGIDDEITNTEIGAASVRILGDRKELYSGECRPRQTPIPLDLNVTGVVELDIIVDYGPDDDIGDRIHLADARLVK